MSSRQKRVDTVVKREWKLYLFWSERPFRQFFRVEITNKSDIPRVQPATLDFGVQAASTIGYYFQQILVEGPPKYGIQSEL